MKTFRVTRSIKTIYLLLMLLMLVGLGFLAYLSFGLFSAISGIGDAFGNSDSPLPLINSMICSVPFLFLLFAIGWMGIYSFAVYKTRLIFDDQAVKLESLHRFTFFLWGSGLKPFTIPYEQIKTIRSIGLAAAVQILDTNGKKFTLAPALFGKNYGEEVLIELQNHLPAERIESGMKIPDLLRKWAKGNKARVVFAVSFVIVYLSTFLVDPMFSNRSWFVPAWNVETRLPLFESVWTYSLISQNEIWLVAHKIDSYRVYHYVSNTSVGSWDMPKKAGYYPDFVSDDGYGKPIVWFEDSVLHYDGAWKNIKYQNNLDLEGWYGSGFVAGNQGWAIREMEEANQLLHIDGLTGEWSEIPLPDTAIQQKLSPQSARQALNGDILVLMTSYTNARVYLLSNNAWKLLEFPVVLLEDSDIRGFFLDEKDSLWVLFSCREEWFVEKINPTSELQITQLQSPQKGVDEWERYENLFIDAHGRMWVNGSYPEFIAVVMPVWKGDATEIVRYTEDNSNYQGTRLHPHLMSSDGRIWTFDRKITTMDTNLETLPAPLPDWLANLDWNLIRLYILLAQFPFYIYLFILSFVLLRPRKQKALK